MACARIPDNFPILAAGTLQLREFRPDDAVSWLEYASDPLAIEGTSAELITEASVIAFGVDSLSVAFGAKTEIRWAISDPATDTLVGSIGFFHLDEQLRSAEIGYNLIRRFWGQGIATLTTTTVAAYGFEALGLRRIEATVLDTNPASMRVLEKVGFRREQTLVDFKVVRGEPRDFVLFARYAP